MMEKKLTLYIIIMTYVLRLEIMFLTIIAVIKINMYGVVFLQLIR